MLLSTAARNAACNAIVDLLDVGSANAQGTLRIGTTSMGTTLAELNLSNPAFGNASTGVATASAISDETAAPATGTAAEYLMLDRDLGTVWSGDVTATSGGGDIELDSTAITTNAIVSITSFTVTVPAGALSN